MKFRFVDRIVELTPRERIICAKSVSLAEEYLADHFPTFPVLPGVLTLQSMVDAASWLVRDAFDFRPTIILLRTVKNVVYKSFVKPGQVLQVDVSCRQLAEDTSEFAGVGQTGEDEVVRARFALTHFSLEGRDSKLSAVDDRIRASARCEYEVLRGERGTGRGWSGYED